MDFSKRKNAFPSYLIFLSMLLFLCSCAGSSAFKRGKKLETLKNYDEALQSFEQALKNEPRNHEYRLYYERARFGKHDDVVTENHQRWNGADLEMRGNFLLVFGVYLGEHGAGIFWCSGGKHGSECAAGRAPWRPEIDDREGVIVDRLRKVLLGKL